MALARAILEELLEINTTDSERGDNTQAVRALERRLLDAGFPTKDVHILIPADAPTKGNLVARYRGRDEGRKPILLLAHVDVVEALRADWSPDLDPFEFIERDGYYYGRGVTDDKNEAAIYTANLIRMRREGFVPDRDIIVALTADEEGGTRNGVAFLLEEHRDLIDAAYALNEGGGGMEKNGHKISNNVQAAEKKFQSFFFTATNPGGHSSLPVRKNAIYDLSNALLAVQNYDLSGHAARSNRGVLRRLGRSRRRHDGGRHAAHRGQFSRRRGGCDAGRGARIQLEAQDHVCGHLARGWSRPERAAPARKSERELSNLPKRRPG